MNEYDSKPPLKAKMIKFGKLCKVQGGFAFKSTWYKGDGIPLVRISSLVNGIVQFDEKTVFLDPSLLKEYSDFTLKKGDTLIAMSGATTGKMAVYNDNQEALLNQRVGRFNLLSELPVVPKYISYLVIQIRDRVLKDAYGAAQPNISPKQIEEIEVPYFPLDEQQRIVAEIEKQFSRLDEAVASLKRIQANLKRYKAAVLKAAVEGKLTEQWRKDHPAIEPADQLLKRIFTERRAKWEAEELAKMNTKGIKPKDDSWKKKYKEPVGPDVANLPELPEGWVWASVEQLTYLVTSGSRGWGDYYSETGYLFIRAQDIKTDRLKFSNVARVNVPEKAEGTRSSVTNGDLLVTITGANVTKTAIAQHLEEIAFVSQHVALLKPCIYEVSQFLYLWLISPGHGRKTLEKWAYGAGKPGLSLEQIRSLAVAIPPMPEQHRVLEEIDCRLSVTEELETTIETNLKRAERLRQTILQRAFSCGLV